MGTVLGWSKAPSAKVAPAPICIVPVPVTGLEMLNVPPWAVMVPASTMPALAFR